jgi:hypothetical protein
MRVRSAGLLPAVAAVAVLALAACGGPKALAPLKDAPTTRPGTPTTTGAPDAAPPAAALAALRGLMEQLLAIPAPPGYGLRTANLDQDPETIGAQLKDEFAGAGFVHGMSRIWVDASGRDLILSVYAFAAPEGARRAGACGCSGTAIAGVPDSSHQTWDGGAGAEAAVGPFVVLALQDRPSAAAGTGTVDGLVRTLRQRIVASSAADSGDGAARTV